jgi:hypothetical protein
MARDPVADGPDADESADAAVARTEMAAKQRLEALARRSLAAGNLPEAS